MAYKVLVLCASLVLLATMTGVALSMKDAADQQSISMCKQYGYIDAHACDDCRSHSLCK